MHIDQPIVEHPKPAEVRPREETPAGANASERLRTGNIGHELRSLATAAAAMHLAEEIRRSLLVGGATSASASHRAADDPSKVAQP